MKNSYKLFFLFIRNFKFDAYFVLFISATAALFETIGFAMIIPLLNMILFNDISSLPFQNFNLINEISFLNENFINLIILVLVLIFILRSSLVMLNIYLISNLSWKLRTYYATEIMKRYTFGDYEQTVKRKYGEIVNDTLTETVRSSAAIRYLVQFYTKALLGFALIIFLILTNFQITLAVLILGVLLFLFQRRVTSKYALNIGRKRLDLAKEHTEQCTEMIESIKEAKILGLQNNLVSNFKNTVNKYSDVNVSFNFVSGIPQPIIELLIVLLFCSFIYFGNLFSFGINENFAEISVFFLISIRLFQILSQMIGLRIKFLGNIPSIKNIIDILDKSYASESNLGKKIEKIHEPIEIKNLSFAYHDNDKIFNNLNISIKIGLTGILGDSGSGKSTFVNIITKLLKPNKGEILINKQNLNDININSFRDRISYVSQSPYLFNDTIYNNIIKGSKVTKEDELLKAVKIARADEFINNFPHKFKTIVGNRGANISGGQLQRIAIARAVLRNPDVYIFDECTNALDQETEKLILESIYELANEKIVIMITHNRDLLKKADEIYEIENQNLIKK